MHYLFFFHKSHQLSTKLLHEHLICTAVMQLSLLHADHPCSSSSIRRATLRIYCCNVVCVSLSSTQRPEVSITRGLWKLYSYSHSPQVSLQDSLALKCLSLPRPSLGCGVGGGAVGWRVQWPGLCVRLGCCALNTVTSILEGEPAGASLALHQQGFVKEHVSVALQCLLVFLCATCK